MLLTDDFQYNKVHLEIQKRSYDIKQLQYYFVSYYAIGTVVINQKYVPCMGLNSLQLTSKRSVAEGDYVVGVSLEKPLRVKLFRLWEILGAEVTRHHRHFDDGAPLHQETGGNL